MKLSTKTQNTADYPFMMFFREPRDRSGNRCLSPAVPDHRYLGRSSAGLAVPVRSGAAGSD
jgi:hypothetical protein